MTGRASALAAPSRSARPFRSLVWLVAAPLVVGPMMGATPVPARAGESSAAAARAEDRIEGEWTVEAKRDDGRVTVHLQRDWRSGADHSHWSSTFDARRSDLDGITESQWSARDVPVRFELRRDAGTFEGIGRMRKGRGSGTFAFAPDAAFRRELERLGIDGGSVEDLARLCLHDVSLDWLRGFDPRTVRGVTLDELVRLKVQGVSGSFVEGMRSAGLGSATVDELIRLAVHGVDAAYVHAMTLDGSSHYSADELVRLKVHGVPASMPRELDRLGFPPATADDLVRMQVHGVSMSFVRDLADLGYRGLTADQLIRLHINGVTTSIARRARARHPNLDVEELIRLKQRGEI